MFYCQVHAEFSFRYISYIDPHQINSAGHEGFDWCPSLDMMHCIWQMCTLEEFTLNIRQDVSNVWQFMWKGIFAHYLLKHWSGFIPLWVTQKKIFFKMSENSNCQTVDCQNKNYWTQWLQVSNSFHKNFFYSTKRGNLKLVTSEWWVSDDRIK